MLGLALYLIGGAIAWQTTNIAPERAWEFLTLQLKIGLMALVTITLIRDAKQIQTFAWVIVAVLGYLSWDFNYQYYFEGWNRVYWVGFGGIDNNGVAMIMVMGVPLAFFMGFRAPQLWVKGLCFAAVLMQIHVILFSFSRGGQLGLCIVAAAIFVISIINLPRKGLTIALGIVALIFGLIFAGAEVTERFYSIFADKQERDTSAASRFLTWGAAWACIKDYPLGVGPRNFNLVSHLYGLDRNKSVHNLFLQTGADYGVLGMAGLVIFYFGSMWSAFRMALTKTAKRLGWPRYFGHMICIALGGFLICSQFIGIETVEAGFIISLLGLCTVSYVRQVARVEVSEDSIPELADMPRHDPHAMPYPA
jgi:O-antigen ligase